MQKKIKILFLDTALDFGGSIVVLINTLKGLDSTRFEAYAALSLPKDIIEKEFNGLNVSVSAYHPRVTYLDREKLLSNRFFQKVWTRRLGGYCFSLMSALGNFPAFFRLFLTTVRIRPDLVHINNGLESLLLAKLLRAPTIVHFHGLVGVDSRLLFGLIQGADKYLAVSNYIADKAIQAGYPSSKMMVLPNPCPSPKYDPVSIEHYQQTFNPHKKLVIAHVGRVVEWKGQKEFLAAFSIFSAGRNDAIALIVGDDANAPGARYAAELKSIVRDSDLEKKVIFTGHIRDVQNVMSVADIIVHSSIDPEPFGLVITEAMSLGLPVIVSSLGAPAEIVQHGSTGLVVNPTNRDALAACITQLAEDTKLRQSLGAHAQEAVQKNYSLTKYTKDLMDTYASVLTGGDREGL